MKKQKTERDIPQLISQHWARKTLAASKSRNEAKTKQFATLQN